MRHHLPDSLPPCSRRTFAGAALAIPFIAGWTQRCPSIANAIDIEPVRSPFYRLLAQTPVRPGEDGAAFPVTSLADFTLSDPESLQSTVMPGLPVSNAMTADWTNLFGFHPDKIEVIAAQDDTTGFLVLMQGQFSFETIEQCTDIWAERGYLAIGEDREPFRTFQFAGDLASLAAALPHLPEIAKGHYRMLAFLDNATLVMAEKPDALDAARLAMHRSVPTMEFAPGASGFLHNEPANIFEAIVMPGSLFAARSTGATPMASDGTVDGLLGVVAARAWSAPDAEGVNDEGPLPEIWYLVVTVDRVDFDDTDSGDLYAGIVQDQFATATSRTSGKPFGDMMTLTGIDVSYSVVAISLTPQPGASPNIIELARNNDLVFLNPPG